MNALIQKGIEGEIDQSRYINRLNARWDETVQGLTKTQYAQLGDILFVGDAEGVEFTDAELKAQGVEDAKVRKAYQKTRRLFTQIGRIVDNHRRSMLPTLRKRKQSLIRRMARMTVMDDAEFKKLYGRRTRLRVKLRRGEGDPEAIAKQLEDIEASLDIIREQQDEFVELQNEIDQIDARLAQTSIRTKAGYLPHKFFGTWRLFRAVEGGSEEGVSWEHIAGDQGFFPTRQATVSAAKHYLESHPGETLKVAPVGFHFPAASGSEVSDATYHRFVKEMQDRVEIEGDALREAMQESGVRKRFRHRVAGFAQKRQGVQGYSKNLDRVMRAHIGEAVRYVMLDRLKFDVINAQERHGLSRARRSTPEQETTQRFLEAWWRDVNGQKQPIESQMDRLLSSESVWAHPAVVGGAAATAMAGTMGVFTGGTTVALVGGAYVGQRVYRTLSKAGEFKSRAITSDMLGDMAHLKLGMVLNAASAMVNLSQTALNTYPILGAKWTSDGIRRYIAARASGQGNPNNDLKLLLKEDVATRFKVSERGANLFDRQTGFDKASMYFFDNAEQFNRGVAFLGAYHKALDEGATPGEARRKARRVVQRTQFHYGNAAKPAALRNVFGRVPLQFKNFLSQEIAFIAGLGKDFKQGNHAPLVRFLFSLFLIGGMVGLPALELIDWIIWEAFDFSPVDEMKAFLLDKAGKGELDSTLGQALIRGVPAAVGVDISERAGVGFGFLPLQASDAVGPWINTVRNAGALAAKNATIIDQIRNLSAGLGAPLKSLEAAANGVPLIETMLRDPEAALAAFGDDEALLTSPWKGGKAEYEPTDAELAIKAFGFRPTSEALRRDVNLIASRDKQWVTKRTQRYITEIVNLQRTYARDPEKFGDGIEDVLSRASESGIQLTAQQVKRGLTNAGRARLDRLIRTSRKSQRPHLMALIEGVEAYTGRPE